MWKATIFRIDELANSHSEVVIVVINTVMMIVSRCIPDSLAVISPPSLNGCIVAVCADLEHHWKQKARDPKRSSPDTV